MNHAEYMSKPQLDEYMWLSACRQIFERILVTTEDKKWRQKIKTCDTLIDKIINERWQELSSIEQPKVWRRIEKIRIKVYSYDDYRVDREDYNRKKTISQEDFFDLVDAASLNCMGCPQGDIVKECPRRKMFHRLGLSCHTLREQPESGECEFRGDNEQYAVTPQYKRLDKELIEQLP